MVTGNLGRAILLREPSRQCDVGEVTSRIADRILGLVPRVAAQVLDPLEPGIVVGKSSAMAFGGRWLYRLLVRERGMDPTLLLVTDLTNVR